MEDIIIGMDLAKRIFQLHGATGSGEFLFRKRLTRDQFRDFMSRQGRVHCAHLSLPRGTCGQDRA